MYPRRGLGDALTPAQIYALSNNPDGSQTPLALAVAKALYVPGFGSIGNVKPSTGDISVGGVVIGNMADPGLDVNALSLKAQALFAQQNPAQLSTATLATANTQSTIADKTPLSVPAITIAPMPIAPPGTPSAPAPISVYMPYGTAVTLANGQPGYADGHGGTISGNAPGSVGTAPAPATQVLTAFDPTQAQLALDPGVNPPDVTPAQLTPALQAAVGAVTSSVPSWALWGGAAGIAYLLFRPRRA